MCFNISFVCECKMIQMYIKQDKDGWFAVEHLKHNHFGENDNLQVNYPNQY
jgi:hypothetical protein